jgi:hypothetical protein
MVWGLAKHLQPAMMILWTNDPLIKRRMLGGLSAGRFAVAKALVSRGCGLQGDVDVPATGLRVPLHSGLIGSTHRRGSTRRWNTRDRLGAGVAEQDSVPDEVGG